MPITRTILETAAAHPDRTALAGEGAGGPERLTYAELVADSRRAFAAIDALHRAQERPPAPAPETRGIPITAVSLDSAFHAARIMAGLAGYRAVSATIDPRWPLAHRLRVIETCGIGVVISDDPKLAAALAERGWGGTIIGSAALRELEASAAPAPPPTVRDGDEAFLLLFSSGTTSDPKAFLKTRRQYRENVAVSAAHLEPLPGVDTLAPGPLSYSLTLYAVIECLATGGGAHVADAFDPFAVARRVRAERITRIVAVPAIVQAVAEAARRDPDAFAGLELVVTGGANLPAAIRDALARSAPSARLISYYGAAEIGFIGDSRAGDGTRIRVYPTIGVSVRDDAGAELPAGELGTLWIRAAACSDGYVAGTTDAVLVGADGWATVHDQARLVPLDRGGSDIGTAGGADAAAPELGIELAGRAGDIVATGGHKVALPEVERAFDDAGSTLFGGRERAVCAIALPDPTLGSIVALVVEAEPGAAGLERGALRAHAAARLAPQYVPRRWYRADRLPRTVGGKIRRGETTERVAAAEDAPGGTAPAAGLERL